MVPILIMNQVLTKCEATLMTLLAHDVHSCYSDLALKLFFNALIYKQSLFIFG